MKNKNFGPGFHFALMSYHGMKSKKPKLENSKKYIQSKVILRGFFLTALRML